MKFPRSHLVIMTVLGLGLASFVVAKFQDDDTTTFNTETTLATLQPSEPLATDITPLVSSAEIASSQPADVEADESVFEEEEVIGPEPNVAAEIAAKPDWQEITSTVRPGDTLASIFKRHGLSPRDVHAVSTSQPLGKRLRSIYPGHELVLYTDEADQLMAVHYATGPLDTLVFEREGKTFSSRQVTEEPDKLLAYKHGIIDHSLFIASQRIGLNDNLTMRLAQIFQWDVDFVLDIRPGDSFYVVYEELYLEGEHIGYGNILAAEFVNQGDRYRAIQYVDEQGDANYFAPNGDSMRKAFLRAPVEFSRISSNFNLRRVHPLFNTVRPHRGIDYAAPTGTPILAAGDGRISKASRTKPNGNFVIIQHGEQFVTKYLHLSKFARGIRSGAKVNQGQVIGYVGATGWATAPHLHYEFLVNGVHQNPRTVALPDAEPIANTEMQRFQQHSQRYSVILDNYKNQVALASAR